MWAERRAPSAPTWLLILALHAGALALLDTRRPRFDLPRAWSQVRLIPARPASVDAPPPVAAPRPHPPAVPDLPRTAAASVDAPAPAAIDMPPPAVIEPLPPLQLALPAPAALSASAARQPALDDPRANTHISRIGERIANDLGGNGRWQEERMDDFVRLRRGNTCINLHRNRGAVQNPFNESVAPTPQGTTPAYRCERR
ncbi:hypothetical protein [Roseateles sp.]|uniref:hypothetical protein n=1 Tax=Roseateles sp. TaxID=1971397 RepID=UPI003BAC1C77